MAQGIKGAPNEYDFGLEFNYALWTPGTTITLCNVPWNNDYRDIVSPAFLKTLDTYIDNSVAPQTTIDSVTYVRPNTPVRVPIPVNTAMQYNYMRVNNPLMPVGNDTKMNYYYFITNVSYLAPNTTEITVQLDVWATYGTRVNFGRCYIDRGHIGIANTNQMNNYGRDYLAIPEGLDTGGEYRVINVWAPNHYAASEAGVVVMSTVDLTQDAGSISNPILVSAKGGTYFGLGSGASIYVWANMSQFASYMAGLQDKPWVTQGIISVTLVPNLTAHFPQIGYWEGGPAVEAPAGKPNVVSYSLPSDWRSDYAETLAAIPERYRQLKKFLTFPYLAIELTTFSGTPAILRPENWNDEFATVNEYLAPIAPSQRLILAPRNYNSTTPYGLEDGADDGGSWLDVFTMLGNFPSLAVVNNMALEYVAANRNQIAWQYQNADWSQQRALQTNQIGYDQATGANQLSQQLAQNTIAQNSGANSIYQSHASLQGAMGAVGTVGSNLLGGAVVGGLAAGEMQALSTMVTMDQANQQTALQNTFTGRNNRAVVNQANFVRDTNKQLADWAARGDYENTIAGINAKVQDSKLTEPSTSGQVGGDAFGMTYAYSGVNVRWKLIDPVAVKVIGEYWLRYGYAIRVFLTPPASLMCMDKFTYWKMQESYLTNTNIPENFKQAIRGIFEKGVTVWSDANDIGNIDTADNTVLEGISY